jgi:uncharacterized protein YsxB (DUF464 family)
VVRARLSLDASGRILTFEGRGHADSVEQGFDPACAAFSVLSRTAWEALEGIEGLDVRGSAERPGELRFRVFSSPEGSGERIRGITDFLVAGLRGLERDFPGSFRIRIEMEGRKRYG